MLPFGVTIPATVPQVSEIPEWLKNNPVHQISGDKNCHRQLQIFTFVVLRRHPRRSEILWHNKFREEREDLENDKLACCPVTFMAVENGEKMRTLMRTDSRLRIKIKSEELHVNKGRIRWTSTTNMNMKCVRKGHKNIWVKSFQLKDKYHHSNTLPTLLTRSSKCNIFLCRKFDSSLNGIHFRSMQITKWTWQSLTALS